MDRPVSHRRNKAFTTCPKTGRPVPGLTRLPPLVRAASYLQLRGNIMRFGMLALAMAALMSAVPAKAATWILDIVAYADFVTTTDTYYCSSGLPFDPAQCPLTTVEHNHSTFSRTIVVDDFIGSTSFDEQIGFARTIAGTISLINGSMYGTDFSYYDNDFTSCRFGAYGCHIAITRAIAPTFQVNFVQAYGGPGPVPEPATWAMMLAGFGIAGMAMRRRPLPLAKYKKCLTHIG